MGSLIVVHGTGVRQAAYDETFAVVEAKLHLARPGLAAVPCYWGDLGANLPKDPLCLPRDIDRGVGAARSEVSVNDWAVLYESPYAELAMFPISSDGRGRSEIRELADQIRLAGPDPAFTASLQELGKLDAWRAARDVIVAHPDFLNVVQRAGADSTSFRATVARGIVAQLTKDALASGRLVPDDELRDTWVARSTELFRPPSEPEAALGTRGLSEIRQGLTGMLGWGGQWLAAGFAERKRMAEAESIAPVVGDIVLYQSPRGDLIRQELVKALRNAAKPRYVLAHSLGSVAAVDTAVLHDDLEIEHLFTIGSPAPVFYELNALVSLTRDQPLPKHFPKWTNIYDPKDLISYIAHRTFHYDDRVADQRHESGQPLLAAHSAYWASHRSWAFLWNEIP